MSELMDDAVINMPYEIAMSDEIYRMQFYNRSKDVLAERDELRAKLVAMESQEPVAWANNQGETTINEIQVEYWQRGGYEVTPLYAKPVPADKQERITEQDAREIAISILIEPDADLKTTYIDGWLLAEGITLLNKLNADREQVPVVDAETHTSYCALNTINDDQVRKVVRAFWRRIYPYRNNYGIELPTPMPVEFMAHMATALTWVDKPAPPHSRQSAEYGCLTKEDLFAINHAIIYLKASGDKKLADNLGKIIEARLGDRCPSHESEQPRAPTVSDEFAPEEARKKAAGYLRRL